MALLAAVAKTSRSESESTSRRHPERHHECMQRGLRRAAAGCGRVETVRLRTRNRKGFVCVLGPPLKADPLHHPLCLNQARDHVVMCNVVLL
jgi:hypothetical protein